MSQFYVNVNDGNLPPDVPTQFTADDATIATASGNNLNVFTTNTSSDHPNGIRSTTNSGDTLYYELTNRIQASLDTVDATPTNLFTFDLGATPSSYNFDLNLAVFDSTNSKGAAYKVLYGIKTDGASGSDIGFTTPLNVEDLALNPSSLQVTIQGNNLVGICTGIAATNINWQVVGYYIKAS